MLRLSLVAALVVGLASPAAAGKVKLVNQTYDNIPEVVVVVGKRAPDIGEYHSYTNVRKGQVGEYEDRICYKRTRDPGDPKSKLTSWTCAQTKAEDNTVTF